MSDELEVIPPTQSHKGIEPETVPQTFLEDNDDGTKNNDMLHAVNALLHYVGSDQVGFNDGFNYIHGVEDIV